jgi:tRNA pseudouridine13 synthase
LKAALDRSHRRSIVTYLTDHPTDFRGAFARLRTDLRSLYLSAYQSFLWNRLLATLIREQCPAEAIHEIDLGPDKVAFFRDIPEARTKEWQTLELPLPSARQHLEEGPLAQLCERVLVSVGMEMRQLRVKYPRDSFFSRGTRAAFFVPTEGCSTVSDDDLYPGKKAVAIHVDQPRGTYATVLIKRVMLG